MGFAQIIAKTWQENVLFSVMVELTYQCNLKCSFCYNDLGLKGTPLTVEEYFHFFEDLRDMEVMDLILTGGEPLAHPDFFALGDKARELGFLVRIKSNGHTLRGRVAQRLKDEVDPFVIDLSLHGASAATHDRQTCRPGSFERLMQNIPELLDLGLRLKLNCTMTRWNAGEIEEMFAIADGFGIRLSINPFVSPRDDGDRSPLALEASREEKLALYRLAYERAENRGSGSPSAPPELGRQADDGVRPVAVDKSCGAGASHVTIDPFGNVLPCVQWRRPVGNLHDDSIRDIWANSTGLDEVRGLSVEAKKRVASQGPNAGMMSYCLGLADLHSGDPLAVYPSATEKMTLLTEVETERARNRVSLPVVA